MPDEIQPALTPEEWAEENGRGSCKREGFSIYRPEGAEVVVISAPSHPGVGLGDDAAPALMALANAQLADDDPRKITPHSVWIVRKLIEDAYIDMQHPGAIRFKRDAEQLAVKLAALLPPNA